MNHVPTPKADPPSDHDSRFTPHASPPKALKNRFKELYQLAHGGDTVAKADLWLEFQFAYDHDPLPAFMRDPSLGRACSPNSPPPTAEQQSNSHSAPSSCSLVPSRGNKNPSAPNNQRSSASISGSKKQSGGAQ
ncbi:hypothetical protein P4B35_08825 [Pontiellaceae bacterium B12227]|nr:hypothetical protein [Pontiellaceae bacterium B12227]